MGPCAGILLVWDLDFLIGTWEMRPFTIRRWKTVCARGACVALLGGPSTSPLDVQRSACRLRMRWSESWSCCMSEDSRRYPQEEGSASGGLKWYRGRELYFEHP